MKRYYIAAFRQLDHHSIRSAFRVVVLGQFGAKPPGLHPHHGIELRVKIGLPAKNFRRNLVFLNRHAGVLNRLLAEVP
jgi:hypothetical protein